jgi:hypothetical protein
MTQKEDEQSGINSDSKKEAKNSIPINDIDLDKLKNEFHEVDFHPMEAKPPDKYMYSVYFDNL